MEQLLSPAYLVVIADCIGKKSFPTYPFNTDLSSWNKFKIIEILSSKHTIREGPLPPEVPSELRALGKNEFLVFTLGGTLMIEGVEVISDIHQFTPSQRYLLFTQMDSGGKLGHLPLGPAGVFKVKQNQLEPLQITGHPVQEDMAVIYKNSLAMFRQAMTQRSASH